MNTKSVVAIALAGMLFCIGAAHGQTYDTRPSIPYGEAVPPASHAVQGPSEPSSWILYNRSETCCGPVGGHGPIATELYLQPGLSFPFGGGVYGNLLKTGYTLKGGARVHFYNQPATSSWFLDFSISNTWNQERDQNTVVPISLVVANPLGQQQRVNFGEDGVPGIIVRDLNRTFVNFGGGRAWYLADPQDCNGWHWRVGVDGGGRWGGGRARFDNLQALSDQVLGIYFAGQADVVIPCGCCALVYGVRTEYAYTWTRILQSQNNADFQEINLLLNIGVRY